MGEHARAHHRAARGAAPEAGKVLDLDAFAIEVPSEEALRPHQALQAGPQTLAHLAQTEVAGDFSLWPRSLVAVDRGVARIDEVFGCPRRWLEPCKDTAY
jgi:hypothetical protein